MKRMLMYSFSSKNLQLVRMLGAFLFFAGLLMFFQAGVRMFETWENIKVVNNCIISSGSDLSFIGTCQQIAKDSMGIYFRPDQSKLGIRQLYSAVAPDVANLFIWIAVLMFGYGLYTSIKVTIPVEEEIKRKNKK